MDFSKPIITLSGKRMTYRPDLLVVEDMNGKIFMARDIREDLHVFESDAGAYSVVDRDGNTSVQKKPRLINEISPEDTEQRAAAASQYWAGRQKFKKERKEQKVTTKEPEELSDEWLEKMRKVVAEQAKKTI